VQLARLDRYVEVIAEMHLPFITITPHFPIPDVNPVQEIGDPAFLLLVPGTRTLFIESFPV
jgi:hypothetical protein